MDIYRKYLNKKNMITEADEYWSDLMSYVFEFIDTLDIDNLTEEQDELLEEILTMYSSEDDEMDVLDDSEDLSEVKKKLVVRAGKRMRKIDCPEGKKAVNGKCVRITASEKRVRSKSAKKSARKRKGKQAAISRKRAKSLKKR